jgi:hypothetical protein
MMQQSPPMMQIAAAAATTTTTAAAAGADRSRAPPSRPRSRMNAVHVAATPQFALQRTVHQCHPRARFQPMTIIAWFVWRVPVPWPQLFAAVFSWPPCFVCAVRRTNGHRGRRARSNITTRPKVALVLSGGGARGFAHIGVLRALQELRIPIDMVVGTSMGSVVGGAYAAGSSVDQLEQLVRRTDWNAVVADRPPRDELVYRRREEDLLLPSRIEFGAKLDGVSLAAGRRRQRGAGTGAEPRAARTARATSRSTSCSCRSARSPPTSSPANWWS